MSTHTLAENASGDRSQSIHTISGIDSDSRPADAPRAYPVEFTGSGSEYFRIWIVNLLLGIATLGVYSAWGKVRTQRYLHFNTRIDGASFGYHVRGLSILKGRAVAVLLFVAYLVLTREMQATGLAITALGAVIVLPWLLYRSLRFRLANTSYRGLRFGFQGPLWKSYIVFALYPILTLATLYLLTPFTHRAIKSYQHNHSTYGDARFSFHGKTADFYIAYLLWLVLVAALAGLPAFAFWRLAAGSPEPGVQGPDLFAMGWVWAYAVLVCCAPVLAASLRNLIWNATALGPHRVISRVSRWKYLYIFVTNGILVVLTLGLFTPFAKIRRLRYVASRTTLVAAGSIEEFVAGRQDAGVGAAGDETADIFGIDIAL